MPKRSKLPILQRIDLNNPDTYVTCQICNGLFENLTQHVNVAHKISGSDYLAKYGGTLRAPAAAQRHAQTMKQYLSTPEGVRHWQQVQNDRYAQMSKEQRQRMYGTLGDTHPLWGKHHTAEACLKNSTSNKSTWQAKIIQMKKDGVWDAFCKTRIRVGIENGMYNTDAPKGSGRCKYIPYTSTVSGCTFLLQGSYELRFAKILDKLHCMWEKTKDRFPYVYENKARTYNPDFKVFRSNNRVYYYETKGYIDATALVKFKAMHAMNVLFIVVNKQRLQQYERHVII